MASTHSQEDTKPSPSAGDKRQADSKAESPSKKAKVAKHVKKEDSPVDEGAGQHVKHEEEEHKPRVGGTTKENAVDEKPAADGMDEKKRDEKPRGKEVEGNAGPGEIAPGHRTISDKDAARKHGLLEKGHIYMLYRPKVETEEPHSVDDIQRFHLLLVPEGGKLHRLIAVGKKAMPDAAQGTRPMWGEVLNVGEDLKALKDGLGPKTYETKTRGTRHQPGARVAGAGAYVLHATENPPKGSANMSAVYHTYLAYELAVPHELGEVQEALHIHEEGAFTLQVKNPDSESTNPIVGNQPESKHPQFPPALKHLFTTKFIPADPPALLDYAGAELLFIPSKHKAREDIGEGAKKELDEEEKELEEDIHRQKARGEAKQALREVGLEGLIEGKALEGHWE
ncbi:hypothetical protein JCM10213_000319 [Rhodosporidiobolus nylandii]